jgi:hypothetical protein
MIAQVITSVKATAKAIGAPAKGFQLFPVEGAAIRGAEKKLKGTTPYLRRRPK